MSVPIDALIAYEQGELDEQDTIALFQSLLDSGLCWQLQGHYGRVASAMLDAGLISHKMDTMSNI